MRHHGSRRLFLTVAGTLLATLALSAPALAGPDHRTVRILDDCDPVTFNAAGVPGGCFGNGHTTIDALFAQLVGTAAAEPTLGNLFASLQENHPAKRWAFSRETFEIDAGGTITAENRGGEVHSFSEVAAFGGGCAPPVNDALGGLAPVPECADPAKFPGTLVPQGRSLTVAGLSPGTHLYMCLIHPWMQSVAKVEQD
jgi:plastocyanin